MDNESDCEVIEGPLLCVHCKKHCSQKRRITPKVAEFITKETGRVPNSSDVLCNKCRSSIQKSINYENMKEGLMEGSPELDKLTFRNPGRFMESFKPEKSGREMRKAKRKTYREQASKKAQHMYDEKGRLSRGGADLCDCLDQSCPGCFLPCVKCGSEKCGPQCRVNRKWFFLQTETESHGDKRRFPFNFDH